MSDAPVMRLTDRLRGKYTLAVNDGAGLLNGSDTFTRQFETPPIHHEAAAMIDELLEASRDGEVWLAAALDCATWSWDADQREAATDNLARIRAVIAKAVS